MLNPCAECGSYAINTDTHSRWAHGHRRTDPVMANFRVNRHAKAGRLGPSQENVPCTSARAKVSCRVRLSEVLGVTAQVLSEFCW
jgi:hypothetical protein